MAAVSPLVELLRTSDMFLLMGYKAPLLRVNRALRSAVDVPHLRNIIWGRECGHCVRAGPSTWVFIEDLEGKPLIYLCVLCHRRIRLYDHEDHVADTDVN